MRLTEVLNLLVVARCTGDAAVEFQGIEADSRQVKPGDLFICVRGFTVDGHDFAWEAVARGAVALLVERPLELDVPQIIVRDSRRAMALVSDLFFYHPSHQLGLIGVTGTNGKTTTTHLIEKILSDEGHMTGLIGTIHNKLGGQWTKAVNTTPEVLELERMLKQMVDWGTEYAVMEVSSHALDMGRVRGCRFRGAVFTNLTQDHLDYHGTMEAYRYAKSLLFSGMGNSFSARRQYAVLNADDPASGFFARVTAQPVVTYGIDNDADVRATGLKLSPGGSEIHVETFCGPVDLHLQLAGRFSVYNALAALSVALIEGVSLHAIARSLAGVSGVPGRFERIDVGQDFTVIVDYAHTPDSLQNVLKTIRGFASERVICIVGCGGDRDRGKRPEMARIAADLSDRVIFTSDNPRSEEPEVILDDMMKGVAPAKREKVTRLVDRREAIYCGVREARPGDVVLIAGKGHEDYQQIGKRKLHFDDREVAREAIWERIQ